MVFLLLSVFSLTFVQNGFSAVNELSEDPSEQVVNFNLTSRQFLVFLDALGADRRKYSMFCNNPEKFFRFYENSDDVDVYKFCVSHSSLVYVPPPRDWRNSSTGDLEPSKSITKLVWLYATLATLVITCSAFGVILVTHFLKRFSFEHIYTFTIALGIGCLLGDALLHLLPHAFTEHKSHNHYNDVHRETDSTTSDIHFVNIMKGFTALLSIQLLLVIERFMHLRRHVTESEVKKNLVTKHFEHVCHRFLRFISKEGNTKKTRFLFYLTRQFNLKQPENRVAMVSVNPSNTIFDVIAHHDHVQDKSDSIPKQEHVCEQNLLNQAQESPSVADVPYINQSVAEGTHGLHDHSHIHLIVGKGRGTIYLLMVGELIHTAADGLAIGAAFAENFASGLGTAIAVFCHELPHMIVLVQFMRSQCIRLNEIMAKIGNFTVLIKLGLSFKRAMIFKGVSALLSLMGSYIGILIGNLSNLSPWIFCIIAGVFVYLALVDMLPQLPIENKKVLKTLLSENLGFLFGIGLMLVIAIFEDELQSIGHS